MTTHQTTRLRFGAAFAVFALLLGACADDGSVSDVSDDESSQGSDSNDGDNTETPVDPSPLEYAALDAAMDDMVSEYGIAQSATVSIDGSPALITTQEFGPDSTVAEVTIDPELVGLDMDTYGDLAEQYADADGLLHSGSFANRERAGLSGFLLVTQGFPVTFDDFNQPRYLEDETSGEQIEPVPATYREAWDDDGLAPNEIPPEYVILTFEEMDDIDGTPVRRYVLTIDEDAAAADDESFDDSGYPVTIWVDENDVLRRVLSAPITSEGVDYQMQLEILDLDGTPMELPEGARSFTLQELEYIATPPPATLPAEHQELLDFSNALETAVDDFTNNSPFNDL